MNFVKAPYPFRPEEDFWSWNPFVRYIKPFDKLYSIPNSSDYGWAMWIMCDPDETENTLYRQPEEMRKDSISRMYPNLDWENPVFQECLEIYPFECMNAIERALHEEKESLRERAKLIQETEYTLDKTQVVNDAKGGEKAITIKGTAAQLDTMRKASKQIYADLEELLAKFTTQKDSASKVKGGRNETPTEKGLI
jgi:hypothetical protein